MRPAAEGRGPSCTEVLPSSKQSRLICFALCGAAQCELGVSAGSLFAATTARAGLSVVHAIPILVTPNATGITATLHFTGQMVE